MKANLNGVEKTFQSQKIRNKCRDICMEKNMVKKYNKKVLINAYVLGKRIYI